MTILLNTVNSMCHKAQLIPDQVRLSTLYHLHLIVPIATLAVHVQQAGAAHVIQQLVDMKAEEITDMLIEVIVY